jgi:Asp-tRNA(Asn)/Glu-tRNA(Gln) amidotransferase A subunit family amidase
VPKLLQVSGHDSTRGYATDLNTTRPVDALLIAKMRKLGAIPFVQTNVPQTLLSFGCSNPIYGTTTHPCSSARSSGGSSGGEGALIGCGGSPLGFGTDVAGSIRVPAHCCGIAGIKVRNYNCLSKQLIFQPTSNRISPVGLNRATPGFQMLMAAVGPMAPSVSALIAACRWLLGDFEATDPYVIAMPFDDNVLNAERALTIGFYEDDGYFEPVTACRRAVLEARDALLAQGHNVVRWTPPGVPRAIQLSLAMCNMDGGRVLSDLVGRDIAEPFHATMFAFYGWPNWLRRLLAVFCSSRVADTLTGVAQSTAELRALFSDIQQYRRVFVESWQAAGLDAVICPPQACPALPPNLAMEVPGAFSYTMLYNLLDFPAGVVKCTTVTAEDENATKQYSVVDYWSKMIKKASTEGTVGLPIGVQCAALPLKEEICLRVMQDIEKGCASYSA